MSRLIILMLLLAAVLAGQQPCVLTQVDASLFPSESKVAVYAMSGRVNCPEPPVVEISEKSFAIHNFVRFALDRWESSTGEWQQFKDQFSSRVPSGIYSRVRGT